MMLFQSRGTTSLPVTQPSATDGQLNTMLRTNGELFAGALREATNRADAAVGERERLSALLDQCRHDLGVRDDYLKAAAPEVRALRDQLREAQDALLRVEAYFGAAAMAEAQANRGWLRRALAMGADRIADSLPLTLTMYSTGSTPSAADA